MFETKLLWLRDIQTDTYILNGYGAVAYLHLKDENNDVHCSFLLGKARVSPVKITIPRLELVAATLATRISDMLVKQLDDKPDFIKYHMDSTTVL